MRTYLISLTLVSAAVIAFSIWHARRIEPAAPRADAKPHTYASYASSIQPIFDRRCVPCHACYDSPCQLTLQSFEGFDRGANKDIVYYPERALTAKPTRMFQDAQTTARWQSEFGFFPVVDRDQPNTLARSMLWRYLTQRADYERGKDFDVDSTTSCPRNQSELENELRARPERGMPFGFPALTANERNVLGEWLRNGAGGYALDRDQAEHGVVADEIAKWESFFNQRDPKMPLVSAYLFEHLFYAHLQFESAPGSWFRLVRSRTPPGRPSDEIATRRPYDDPGPGQFYYRLRRIRETLVLKTHVPYSLSDAKLDRLQTLFYRSDWTPPPSAAPFDPEVAANPFIAFASIPARARYQFMLDDARYHVQVFIHGPVCRGQAALDVIEEQFLIFFLAPDSDPSISDPAYLASVADELALPAEHGGTIAALSPGFDAREIRYLAQQAKRVRARGRADVWNGDGTNSDAVLTVFRHYDNAFVARGALGGMPKTAWLMDYPILERMYYDLVAGFDVYGNLAHQLATRIYMNLLRIESEGQFLRLLPASERARVHDGWYRGRVARALSSIHAQAFAAPEPTDRFSEPARAKEEAIEALLRDLAPVAGPREPIQWPDVPLSFEPSRAHFEALMRPLTNHPGAFVTPFPDTLLLQLKTPGGRDLVYTIARNRSHKSVEFIFLEGVELEPEEDTLQVVSGVMTSRPNMFLRVNEAQLDDFATALRALSPTAGWKDFVAKYGVRRSDPSFWETFDFFTDAFPRLDPIGAAVLDLSRYSND